MSYIHDALKRAQEEKDSLYAGYGRIIDDGKRERRRRLKPTVFGLLVLLGLVVAAMSPFDSMLLGSKERKAPSTMSGSAEPAAAMYPRFDRESGEEIYRRALDLHERGKLAEAEALYRKIPAGDERYMFALNNRGVVHLTRGDREGARVLFLKALEGNETYVDSWYNLACLYAAEGEKERAVEYLEKALAISSEVKEWAEVDEDLVGLRSLPEYKALMERY